MASGHPMLYTHLEHQLALKNHEVEGAKIMRHGWAIMISKLALFSQQPLCAKSIRPPQLSLPPVPQLPVGRCLLSRQEEQPQCMLSAEQQLSCQQLHWDGLSTSH